MKSITITAPDAIFDQAIEALCQRQGNAMPVDPAAKLKYAKEQLASMLGDVVREYAQQMIRQSSRQSIDATVQASNETITAAHKSIDIKIA